MTALGNHGMNEKRNRKGLVMYETKNARPYRQVRERAVPKNTTSLPDGGSIALIVTLAPFIAWLGYTIGGAL